MSFFLLVNKARYIEDKVLYRKKMIHLNLVFFFFFSPFVHLLSFHMELTGKLILGEREAGWEPK